MIRVSWRFKGSLHACSKLFPQPPSRYKLNLVEFSLEFWKVAFTKYLRIASWWGGLTV